LELAAKGCRKIATDIVAINLATHGVALHSIVAGRFDVGNLYRVVIALA